MDCFIQDMSNGTRVHLPPMPYLSNFWKYKQEEPSQNRLAARAYKNWLPLLLDEDGIRLPYFCSRFAVIFINIKPETAGIYTVSVWKETFSCMGSDKLYAVSVRFLFVNKVLSCGKDIAAGKFCQVGVSLCDLQCNRYRRSYPFSILITFHYLAFVSHDSFLYLSAVVTCDN